MILNGKYSPPPAVVLVIDCEWCWKRGYRVLDSCAAGVWCGVMGRRELVGVIWERQFGGVVMGGWLLIK